jgi:ABC-type amino acid transport substrate-binding protein
MYAELYSEDDDLLHKRKRVNTKTNDDKTNDEPIIKNKQIVIGMIESPPYIYKDKLGNYTGYEYELIKEFVKENKLNVNYQYISIKGRTQTYNDFIDLVTKGKYDILCGNISRSHERSKRIIYSQPTSLEHVSFYFKKNREISYAYYYNITITILKVLSVILFAGLLISFIHFKTSNFKITYKESLWRVWSALLGEPGLGVNPTKFNDNVSKASTSNLTIRGFIIFLSALFGIYLTSLVTSERLADAIKNKPFSKINDLLNKHIVVYADGYDEELLRMYEDTYKLKISTGESDIVDRYTLLTRKFLQDKTIDAFFMSSEEFYYYDKSNMYEKGSLVLERGVTSVVFNKKFILLSQKFNVTLSRLRKEKYLKDLCGIYFKNADVCIQ